MKGYRTPDVNVEPRRPPMVEFGRPDKSPSSLGRLRWNWLWRWAVRARCRRYGHGQLGRLWGFVFCLRCGYAP